MHKSIARETRETRCIWPKAAVRREGGMEAFSFGRQLRAALGDSERSSSPDPVCFLSNTCEEHSCPAELDEKREVDNVSHSSARLDD